MSNCSSITAAGAEAIVAQKVEARVQAAVCAASNLIQDAANKERQSVAITNVTGGMPYNERAEVHDRLRAKGFKVQAYDSYAEVQW